jgi:N-methylhydantoinase A
VPIEGDDPASIREAFDRDYKRRYGHADARAAAEFQALHLSAFTRLRRPELKRLPRAQAAGAKPATRPVYFGAADGMLDAQVYERTALAPGFKADGPALIEEYGSTTLIWAGDRFEIGELGEIRVTIAGNR